MVAATDIEIREMPTHTVAYSTLHGTVASMESAVSSVRSWAVTMGYTPQGPVAVEFNEPPSGNPAQEYDIEIQLPVPDTAKAHPSDYAQIKRFEPARAVVMTLRGPADLTNLGEPLERMRAWMREKDITPGSAVRWVEVTDPTKVSVDEQVTELQYLIRG